MHAQLDALAQTVPRYALFMKSDDIMKRAAELKRQTAEARAKAEQIQAKTQQLGNMLHRTEEIAKQVHARMRRPFGLSANVSSRIQ